MLIVLSLYSDVLHANPDNHPSEAVAGKYIIYKDDYWILIKKSVEEIEAEGYNIPDKYSSDTALLVNYTRLNYRFKVKIISILSSSITVENTEMEHDLQVKVYENEDGRPGELIASFETEDVQAKKREWESEDPHYGVLFNPSIFNMGNKYSMGDLEFSVIGTETLNTPLGEFNTYVLEGTRAEPYKVRWLIWCDSETGLIVKQSNNQEMTQRYISREETIIIETGNKIEVSTDQGMIEVPIETNSIINEVAFDSDSNELKIMVEGTTGTKGELNVTVPKTIVPSEHEFTVYVDDQKREHVLHEDSENYYIYVDYQHSSHTIRISFIASSGIPGFPVFSLWIGLALMILLGEGTFRARRVQ